MSVDIEDQVENPARTKNQPALQELPLDEPKKGLGNPKVRRLLMVGGVVVLALIVGLFLYYHDRESTDDAQVDGHITPVASKIYGRVAEVLVLDNQEVKAGQVLVKIDARDYQARLDQERAALAEAESRLAAARVGVPLSSETTQSVTSSSSAEVANAQAELERARMGFEQSSGP